MHMVKQKRVIIPADQVLIPGNLTQASMVTKME